MKSKIISLADFSAKTSTTLKGQRIVFTNGCFDILHPGHTDYLSRAKKLGDVLVVGLNSDDSVKKLKGPSRPIQTLEARSLVLSALSAVDYIIPFDTDTPLNLIQHIQPDVLVKGGDYTADNIVGADVVQSNGGRVEVIPFLDGYSSSLIIEKIRK